MYPPDVTAFISLDTLEGCAPLSVPIRNLSTPGSIINWRWYDNDSLLGTSTINEPEIQLNQAGRYDIILSAARCGMDLDTAEVVVLETPTPNFSVPDEFCVGDTILIENLSTEGIAYNWSNNDEDFSSIRNPIYTTNEAGIQSIQLEITNDIGCSESLMRDIFVNDLPIRSSDVNIDNGCQPLIISGELITMAGDAIVWDWGDGSTTIGSSVNYIYESKGDYNVTVSITDSNGCSTDSLVDVIVVHPLPIVNFTLNQESFCTGYDSIVSTNNSEGAASYIWKIGESRFTNSSVALPVENRDIQEITLIGTTTFGCVDSLSQNVTIFDSPVSSFSLSDEDYCLGESVVLTNASSFSDFFIWQDNLGNIYNRVEPNIQFSDTGRYTITLTSSYSENNCPDDSQSIDVIIRPNPSNNFTYSLSDSCAETTMLIISNQTNDVISTSWSVNGSELSQIFNPSFELTAGTYDLTLITQNIFGCEDISSESVTIYEAPNSLLSGLNNNYCVGDELIVSNLGLGSSFWSISGIGEFEDQAIDVSLDQPGMYSIEVVGSNGPYCSDTLISNFTVYQSPIADFDFIADTDDYLIGDVQYINQSDFYTMLQWNLGDGTTSSSEDINHIYDINPPIIAILTAINDHNGVITCTDVISKSIESEWVTTFYAPNAMAPEAGLGDAKYFKPVGLGIADYAMTIYSPWGQAIWHSEALIDNSPSEFWDGTDINGNPLPQGVYLWKAEVTYVNSVSKTYTGDIHLIR